MGVNRFTNIPQQEYISQFIPLDLDLINKVGQYKQGQYDKGLQEFEDTKGLFKIDADPYNRPLREQKIKYYNDQINNLSNEYFEKGDRGTLMKLKNIKKEFANDPIVYGLNQSYQNYLLQQKDASNLAKEGKYDPSIYDEYTRYGQNYNPMEEFRPFDYKGTMASADWSKKGLELVKDIAADQTSWTGISAPDENGMIIDSKGTKKHITETKVGQVANKLAKSFIEGGDEGRYYVDQLINKIKPGLGHIDYKALPKELQNLVQQQATKDLFDLAYKQVFEQTTQDQGSKFIPKYMHDEKIANTLGTSFQTEGLNQTTNYLNEVDKIEFNKDGSISTPKEDESYTVKQQSPLSVKGITPTFESTQTRKIDSQEKLNEQNALIESLKSTYGLSGTPEQVIKKYKSAFKALQNESITIHNISNLAAENIGENLSRNILSENMWIMDSKGQTNDGRPKTVIEELGITEQELSDQISKKGISGFTHSGPVAGAYVVEVTDVNDNKRRIMISPPKEFQTIFSASNLINNARKTLIPTEVTPYQNTPNFKIFVKPKIDNDGNPSWEYYERVYDNNKNIISENKTTLTDIQKEERNTLKESNYLGSQILNTKDEEKDIE